MQRDPVCGMDVDEESAAAKVEYKGKTYYFCAMSCKEKFEATPEQYLEDKKNREVARKKPPLAVINLTSGGRRADRLTAMINNDERE